MLDTTNASFKTIVDRIIASETPPGLQLKFEVLSSKKVSRLYVEDSM